MSPVYRPQIHLAYHYLTDGRNLGARVELHQYFSVVRKRLWLIALLGVVGLGLSVGVLAKSPPLYQAKSSVFVSSQSGDTTAELVQGSTYTQQLVQSYAQLATAPIVLNPVILKLNLDVSARGLASEITADTPLNTVIVEITVLDRSPVRATQIANAVASSLATSAENLSPKLTNGESGIRMKVISPAAVPTSPAKPNRNLILASGLLGGLAVGVLIAIFIELLSTRVRDEEDVAKVSDAPVLGRISRNPRGLSGIVMRVARTSPTAEGYRRVRTNLAFSEVDRQMKSIVVTSPTAAIGKSTTTLNLALAMAEVGGRGLVIDADLRKPSIAQYCQMDGDVGLTSVLIGSAHLEDAVQRWGDLIDILPSGLVPPNPTKLLGSEAMATLLKRVTAEYDFVILDSPPVLPVSDALTLAHLTDGVIVVARCRVTKRRELESTLSSIENVNAGVLGVILNVAPRVKSDSYYPYARDAHQGQVMETDAAPVSSAQILVRRPPRRKTRRPSSRSRADESPVTGGDSASAELQPSSQ
jgi:capsular exopolysaccharide synthesis family protein